MAPSSSVDLGGNGTSDATALEFDKNLAVIEDWIGVEGDLKDYYAFNQSQAGSFEITLDNLSNNANLQVIRANGERVGASYQGGTKRDVITGNFGVGDYYIYVFGKTKDIQTSYQLSVSVPGGTAETDVIPADAITPADGQPSNQPGIPEPTEDEDFRPDSAIDIAGESITSAFVLPWQKSGQKGVAQVSDWIGIGGDRKDYYAFTIDQAGEVTLTLSGLSDNAQLKLSDAAGKGITASYQGGIKDDVIVRNLEAGTYYASVFGKTVEVQTAYQLTLEAEGASTTTVEPTPTPAPNPAPLPQPAPIVVPQPEPLPGPEPLPTEDLAGDSISSAQSLAFSNGVAQVDDWIGLEGDRKDYYAFTIDQAGEVTLTLSGLSDNAQLKLSDAAGKGITASYQGGTKDDVIVRNLEAGTYYASVFGKTAEVQTAYQLTIQAEGATTPVEPTPLPKPEPIIVPQPEPVIVVIPKPDPLPAPGPEPVAAVDLAGDDISSALALAFNNGVAQVSEQIGLEGDRKDYYTFTIDQAGEVTLTLSGLSDNAQLKLSDATGKGITASYQGGTKDDVIVRNLEAGTYYASVFGKTTEVQTAYQLAITAPPATEETTPVDAASGTDESPQQDVQPGVQPGSQPVVQPSPIDDWFSNNLQDAELTQLARDRFADGKIDRFDMIDLLRSAGDGNQVDSLEFEDLKSLVGAVEQLGLDDYVENLADKVVNGDLANQWFTGGAQQRQDLGNLQAGSSGQHLDQLVNKWFMGSDRPSTLSASHQYQFIEGSLFQDGLSVTDINQAQLGDCYFMAVLAGAAHEDPSSIEAMLMDNGDGTFTVRFFRNGNAEYVTVDRYLPVLSWSGKSPYAQFGSSPDSSNNELWSALLEKAYAQVNESGWIAQDGTNSYGGIEGGWMSGPIREVLGTAARTRSIQRFFPEDVITELASDTVMTVGIIGKGQYGVVDDHAYTLTDYDAATQTFHLENPWGTRHVDLTWEQLQAMDSYLIYAD